VRPTRPALHGQGSGKCPLTAVSGVARTRIRQCAPAYHRLRESCRRRDRRPPRGPRGRGGARRVSGWLRTRPRVAPPRERGVPGDDPAGAALALRVHRDYRTAQEIARAAHGYARGRASRRPGAPCGGDAVQTVACLASRRRATWTFPGSRQAPRRRRRQALPAAGATCARQALGRR
jgi:hypothetical protein